MGAAVKRSAENLHASTVHFCGQENSGKTFAEKIKGRNPEHDSYIVRFNDGTIEENVMNCELTFDYHRDKASIETRKELSRIMKLYELSDKEAEELLTASYNYDYEMNEGVVLTNLESILMISALKTPSSSLNSKDVRLIGLVKIPQE